jgi:hypothetical protein
MSPTQLEPLLGMDMIKSDGFRVRNAAAISQLAHPHRAQGTAARERPIPAATEFSNPLRCVRLSEIT